MKKLKLFGLDILIFIGFWIVAVLIEVVLSRLTKDYNLISLISYIICFGILLIIYKKEFKKYIQDFKINYKKYISHYLWLGFLGIILMNISSSIIMLFVKDLSTNESAVRETLNQSHIIIALLNLGVLTPICEETIFRLNFKNLFKNKYVFSIVTGVLFGSMHLLAAESSLELLYIIPYSIMGYTLSYIYFDSDNLFNSILVHMINNLFTILIIIRVML